MASNVAPQHPPLKLAVLLSGGGRTLENLVQAIARGDLNAKVMHVISSRADAYGLVRAANHQLSSATVARKQFSDADAHSAEIFNQVRRRGADLVVLAGFLSLLRIPDDFASRVVNIHPALLPAFGGHGMFGHHVHEAVLATGCKLTGCTVHYCDQTYDTGPIIMQRACPVLEDDTPDALAARVFEQECIAYPAALQLIAQGRVKIEGRRTRIRNTFGGKNDVVSTW